MMEYIVQEIAYHLNQARCIEKRTVGNIELANRIFENLALRGFLKLHDPDTVTIKRSELEKMIDFVKNGCDARPEDKHDALSILETALGEKKI